jgi:hypothetical protein
MEEKKILQTLEEYVLEHESKRLVGLVCKRVELAMEDAKQKKQNSLSFDDMLYLKSNIKELIYEEFRNLLKMVETGKFVLTLSKEK